jgi:cytochrome P450
VVAVRDAWGWWRDPYGTLLRAAAAEGPTFSRSLPVLGRTLFTGDPALVGEIALRDDLDAGAGIVGLRSVLGGDSLIMLDGPAHAARKELVAPAFRGAVLDRYDAMVAEVAADRARALPGAFSGHAFAHDVLLDAITRVVFGDDPSVIAVARDRILRFLRAFRSPLPLFVKPLQIDLGAWSGWGRAVAARDALRAVCRERAAAGDGLVGEWAARSGLPPEVLANEILALLLFGHDTGAAQLAWAIAHVHAHGHASRARDDDEWLSACLDESMRLCPVVVHLTRVARADTTVGGHAVPAGGKVCPSALIAQRDPRSWPDPDRFDPARFLRPLPAPWAWFPFGIGARTCVGKPFVVRQMRVVLRTLLRTAPASLRPGWTPRPVRQLVLVVPSDGVPLVRST